MHLFISYIFKRTWFLILKDWPKWRSLRLFYWWHKFQKWKCHPYDHLFCPLGFYLHQCILFQSPPRHIQEGRNLVKEDCFSSATHWKGEVSAIYKFLGSLLSIYFSCLRDLWISSFCNQSWSQLFNLLISLQFFVL